MTKIDWYIIKKFLGTFFFILLLIMSLAVVFDVAENLERISEHNPSTKELVIDYYLNFVIYYSNLFSPLLIFITVILFTSKLAQNTEIVAILSSGVSFNRFLRPYLISCLVLFSYAFVSNHYLIPHARKGWFDFEEKYFKKGNKNFAKKSFHREFNKQKYIYFRTFNPGNNWARDFSLEHWNTDNKLIEEVWAERAYFDTTRGTWRLQNYVIREYLNDTASNEKLRDGWEMDTTISFYPSDMGQRWESSSTMPTPVLKEYIKTETEKGNDMLARYKLELHKRSSMPFATFILTLIGVSVSSKKTRGGTGINLALGIGLTLIFIFFMQVADVITLNLDVPAYFSVWIPNIIFGCIASYLYFKAPK